MIAILYLAVLVLAGDALGRRCFRYVSSAHRWATAFLVGLPLAAWLSYLTALVLDGTPDRLLLADALVAVWLVLLVLVLRRWAPISSATERTHGTDRWDAITILAIGVLVAWMMGSTFRVADGQLAIASGLWSDFGPTTAIAQSFAVGDNFPTEYPHYAGEPIRYHFLYYFQVGNLTHLGLDPATANNVLSIASLVALLVLVMALGRRLFGSAIVGRIGALLFFFHGALSFIPYLASLGTVERAVQMLPDLTSFMDSEFGYRGEEWGIWTQMVFLNQRHLASAIGILLVIVIFLLDRLPRRDEAAVETASTDEQAPLAEPASPDEQPAPAAEPVSPDVPAAAPKSPSRWRPIVDDLPKPSNPVRLVRATLRDPALPGFALCGALAGMLPLWNGSMFIAAAAVLAAWLLLFPNRPQMLVLAATASLLAIPQLLWVRPGTMAGEQTYPALFWGYVIDDPTIANVGTYLAFIFGPKLLLMGVALVVATWRQWRVFLAFSSLVAVAFLLQVSVEVLANHKFINAWLIVANLFVAHGLLRLWRARPTLRIPGRVVAVGLTAVIVVGGVIDLIPIKNQGMLRFGIDGDPLYEFARTGTDPHDVFLTDIYVTNPILLAGREIYYGWPYYAWSAGYDVYPRETLYRELLAERSPRRLAERLRAESIDYVAIDDGLRAQTFAPRLNEEVLAEHFEQVFVDDGSHANMAIYRVPTDAAVIAALPDAPPENMYAAGTGDAPGSLAGPRGLALDGSGMLLVADAGNDRVQRFSSDGNVLDVIGGPGDGPGEFDDPVGVAVDAAGRIYVADAGNNRIQQLESDGTFIAEWTGEPNGFGRLTDIASHGAFVFATDAERGHVVRIAPDGSPIAWGGPESGPGQLAVPTGVAAAGGRVYVADSGQGAVIVFDTDGAFVERWSVPELAAGDARTADVAVGPDGTAWVTSPADDTVKVFGPDRAPLGVLAGEDDAFHGPAGIVVRPAGSLFVAEHDGNRISLLTRPRP